VHRSEPRHDEAVACTCSAAKSDVVDGVVDDDVRRRCPDELSRQQRHGKTDDERPNIEAHDTPPPATRPPDRPTPTRLSDARRSKNYEKVTPRR
jgi:hypothetical protein